MRTTIDVETGRVDSLSIDLAGMKLREESFSSIASLLKSGAVHDQLQALHRIRTLLSDDIHPPIDAIIQAGMIPEFVKYLERVDVPKLQHDAAWALTNIASGEEHHTKAVVESGAIPKLVHLMNCRAPDIADQATWAVGNIAGDNAYHRGVLNEHGAMQALLARIQCSNLNLQQLKTAAWALSNMCRLRTAIPMNVVAESLPVLQSLLLEEDVEIVQDACFACSYLSDGPHDRVQMFIDAGMAQLLISLLRHPEAAIVYPALRGVSNLVSGSDEQTQVVVNCGVVPILVSILRSSREKRIVKEVCWALSNITGGTTEHIQVVLDEDIIPDLVHIVKLAPVEIKKEAIWAIGNVFVGGSKEQIKETVSPICIRILCDILESMDVALVNLGLEALWNILTFGEGLSGEDEGDEHYEEGFQDEDEDFWECASLISKAKGLHQLARLRTHDDQEIALKALDILSLLVEAPDASFSDLDDSSSASELTDEEEEDGEEAANFERNESVKGEVLLAKRCSFSDFTNTETDLRNVLCGGSTDF